MDVLWKLLARDRRREAVACRLGADERVYDYDRFLTTAWRAGNYLRHLGVREGVVVGIAEDRIPETLLAALGSGLLGATAWFDPPLGADLQAMVAPAGEIEVQSGLGGCQRVAYGGSVADPSIERFEEGIWSENPTVPPERPGPETTILTDGNRSYSQHQLLKAATRFAQRDEVGEGTAVVVRAPLDDPGVFIGILGTLRASATVVCPECCEEAGDVALGEGPEASTVDPARLTPES